MRYLMFSIFTIAILFTACNNTSSNEHKVDLPETVGPSEEVAEVEPVPSKKSSADKPDADLQPKLKEMNDLRNSINVQGRTLTKQELAMTAMIDNLLERHGRWEKQWMNAKESGMDDAKQVAMDSLSAIRTDINDLFEILGEMED